MNKLLILIIFSLNYLSFAQKDDSTNIKNLQVAIDSLSNKVIILNNQIQQLKKEIDNKKYKPDDIFDILLSEREDFVPEDQRLKNKRVDKLLRLIRQQPGVLRFNGSATSSFQYGMNKSISKTIGVGSFDIFALTSFGEGTLLFFDIEAIGGNGIDNLIPTFSGLNGDAGTLQDEDGIDRL